MCFNNGYTNRKHSICLDQQFHQTSYELCSVNLTSDPCVIYTWSSTASCYQIKQDADVGSEIFFCLKFSSPDAGCIISSTYESGIIFLFFPYFILFFLLFLIFFWGGGLVNIYIQFLIFLRCK